MAIENRWSTRDGSVGQKKGLPLIRVILGLDLLFRPSVCSDCSIVRHCARVQCAQIDASYGSTAHWKLQKARNATACAYVCYAKKKKESIKTELVSRIKRIFKMRGIGTDSKRKVEYRTYTPSFCERTLKGPGTAIGSCHVTSWHHVTSVSREHRSLNFVVSRASVPW